MDGVEVLIFRPRSRSDLLPGIMLFHGGGWVLGTPGWLFFAFYYCMTCSCRAICEALYLTLLLCLACSFQHVDYNEPHHDKTNKVACAPSEDSSQSGHPPSQCLRCALSG